MACGVLVPQLGIKLTPPAVEACSPNHWTTRKVPPVLCWFLPLGAASCADTTTPGPGGSISHRPPSLLPHPAPSQAAVDTVPCLRCVRPLFKDGDFPRFGTNPSVVSPYPRSVSSPRIADPSIRHWASVVKGNFFWKGKKECGDANDFNSHPLVWK